MGSAASFHKLDPSSNGIPLVYLVEDTAPPSAANPPLPKDKSWMSKLLDKLESRTLMRKWLDAQTSRDSRLAQQEATLATILLSLLELERTTNDTNKRLDNHGGTVVPSDSAGDDNNDASSDYSGNTQQNAAAQVISLWIRRRRIFARLARLTGLRQQQQQKLDDSLYMPCYRPCISCWCFTCVPYTPSKSPSKLREIAARHISLWFRRQHILAQLARTTLRRQQQQAALARLQHEQDCCACARQAEEHRKFAAAAHVQSIANDTNKRHLQAEVVINNTHHLVLGISDPQQHARKTGDTQQTAKTLAVDQRQHSTAVRTAALAKLALANKRCCLGKATATAMSAERSLAKECHCLELATATAISAERSLAKERLRLETAVQTAVLMETALAKERCRLETATATATSAKRSLAKEHHRHETAAQTAESMERVFAKERCRLKTTTALTAPVDGALRRFHAAYATLAAPLDALLADIASIEHTAINHITPDIAALTLTSPSNRPAITSPTVPSYLGAVLNTNVVGHALSVLTTMQRTTAANGRATLTTVAIGDTRQHAATASGTRQHAT